MTWTTLNGVTTHSGTTRDVFVGGRLAPGNNSVVVTAQDKDKPLRVMLLADRTGRNGFEVGIYGTKIEIRSVTWSVTAAVTNGASPDIPASASASVNHGLSSATPFEMEVRNINDVLRVFLNGTEVLQHAITSAEQTKYGDLRYFNLSSDADGAKALSFQICELVADFDPAQTMVVAVSAGRVYSSADGISFELVATGLFKAAGDVDLAALGPVVYGVDGTHGVKLDFFNASYGKWIPDDSKPLPGAIETTPGSGVYIEGSTRMTIVERVGARIVVAGDPRDRQNYFNSAINDGDNWDFDAGLTAGRAWASNVDLPGSVRQPIVGLFEGAKGVLIIGHSDSITTVSGDPAIGVPQVRAVGLEQGVSGKDAFELVEQGRVAIHTPEGLIYIDQAGVSYGVPTELSDMVLTEGINIDGSIINQYIVNLIRDPMRDHLYVFLTPRDTSLQGTHFAYDERWGRYQPGRGGFWPDTFAASSMDPTAAVRFRSTVLMGTRDGKIVKFDPADRGKDLGTAYGTKVTARIGPSPSAQGDFELSGLTVTIDLASSSVRASVYGGRTIQEAYEGANRRLLMARTYAVNDMAYHDWRVVRAPHLVVELANAETGKGFNLEAVRATIEQRVLVTRWIHAPEPTRPVCEDPNFAAATPTDPGFAEGPGPGGDTPTEQTQPISNQSDRPPPRRRLFRHARIRRFVFQTAPDVKIFGA